MTQSVFSRVTGVLIDSKPDSGALGAARSIGSDSALEAGEDPWTIAFPGTEQACVRGEFVTLIRVSDDRPLSVTVEAGPSSKLTGLDWKGGEGKLTLPPDFVSSKSEILVIADGARAMIELNRMPPSLNGDQPMAAVNWMLEKGCARQAMAFLRSLGKAGQ